MDTAYQPSHEKAKLWRAPEFHNMELLSATYIKHKFSYHYHETFGIGVIEEGAYHFYHRGKVERIEQGQILLINPLEVHGGEPVENVGWKYRMFYPVETFMRQLAKDVTGVEWAMPRFISPVVDDPVVANQLLQLHHILEKSDNRVQRDTAMRATFGALILHHAKDMSHTCTPGEREAVRRVREYLETHYENNTSLDELADIAGLSPFHLVRVFKDETGLPPHTYLTHVRVQRARELLKNDPLSIADVAYATGFTDQSHLTRWFKRMVGVTPGKYVAV